MGRIGEVLAFARIVSGDVRIDEVQVDPGGGANVTAQHVADAGDDSQPLPGDFAALAESNGTGREYVAGYHDPKTPRKAGPGAKRIFSRSAPGVVAAEVWLKEDGTVSIQVFNGAPISIKSDGPITVDSTDVRLGRGAGRKVACVGDIVLGSVSGICAAPGSPLAPDPLGAVPVPFAAQIVGSGSNNVKA